MCTYFSECKCNYVSVYVYGGEGVLYICMICWADGDACNWGENSESTEVYDELEMSRTFYSWPGTHDDIFVTWPVCIYLHTYTNEASVTL
jgi:hypothetical protein